VRFNDIYEDFQRSKVEELENI